MPRRRRVTATPAWSQASIAAIAASSRTTGPARRRPSWSSGATLRKVRGSPATSRRATATDPAINRHSNWASPVSLAMLISPGTVEVGAAMAGTAMTIQVIQVSDPARDHELKRAALGYLRDAWTEARLEGVDGDCLAQACLFAAFAEFVSTYGEEAAAQFAEGLAGRIRNGEFSLAAAKQ